MAKVLPLAVLALLVVGCQPKEDVASSGAQMKTRTLTGPDQPAPAPQGRPQASPTESPVSARLKGNESGGHIAAEPMPSGMGKRGGPPPLPGSSGRPEAPAWPKADETLTKRWEKGGSSVELLGVCHITEDALQAWDADGVESSELKTLVEGALNRDGGGGSGISIKYGKKNRVLIFKSRHAYSGGPSGISYGPPMVTGVGPRREYSGGGFLQLDGGMSQTSEQGVHTSYQTYSVAADPSEKTTVAHLIQTEGLSESKTVALRAGATVTVQGVTLTILSIGKADPTGPGSMMYGGARGDAWSIQVKKTGTWPEGVNFALALSEHMEVDEAGNPLTQAQRAERDKKMREAMQSGRGASFDFSSMPRTGILQQIGGANETITYGLNVNPKHVKELVVRGTKQRKIDITNIPLDPK